MTTRIALITAGISEPSSTRLLADRLGAAVLRALPTGNAALEVIEVGDGAPHRTDNVLPRVATPPLQSPRAANTAADALVV
jgi:FMN reductase